jgi:signal transduction histidine kinase
MNLPSSFLFQITHFESKDSRESTELPYTKIATGQDALLSGKLTLPDPSITSGKDEIFVYIPKFEGKMEISADGVIILDESSPTYLGGSGFSVFPISLRSDGKFPILEFSLKEKSKRFILLSKIFLGTSEDFVGPTLSQNLTEFLRLSVFGMNLTVFLVCLLLIVTGTEVYASISSMLISIYFLFSSINSINSFLTVSDDVVYTIALSSPILGMNIYLFSESLREKTKPYAFWTLQAVSFSLAAILVLLANTLLEAVRPLPLAVAVVFVLIPGVVVVVRSISLGWVKSNHNLFFFGLLLMLFQLSVAHDILVRFNYFSNDQYLIALARILFIFGCAYILSNYTLEGSRQLRNANLNLKNSLQIRTNELTEQFAEMQDLLADKVIETERRRLREELDEELHDGVLSYVSVINVITSDSNSKDMIQINKLSRFALNEIRLMMETSERQSMSLLAAITLLRRQFIDRLSELGVEIHFDVVRLSKCRDIDYKVVIECMRILQELLHNAAVRAESRKIEIIGDPISHQGSTGESNEGFRITVYNTSGKTYDPETSSGNGIQNMMRRAKRIGAFFQITPIDGGASATLIWPCGEGFKKPPVSDGK